MRNNIIEEDLHTIVDAQLPWDRLAGKSILITGATGFIAGYIVEALLFLNEQKGRKPIRVICLVRNKKKAQQRFLHYKDRKDIVLLVQDVCDQIRYKKKVDYIIHAASNATPSVYGTDPVGTMLPNILGTYRVLQFAKSQKVKGFLFISSGEVYGDISSIRTTSIKETEAGSVHPLAIRSCYAESKRMGETMCMGWFSQYGVGVKIARLFHTYGPGMRLGDGRVHSDFMDSVVRRKDIVMKSDGRAIRTFCYISDTVRGLFTILLNGKAGVAYNLGSDKKIRISTFADMVRNLDPGKRTNILKDIRDQGKKYLASQNTILCPNISKIRTLGWRPMVSLKRGLQRTVESYNPYEKFSRN